MAESIMPWGVKFSGRCAYCNIECANEHFGSRCLSCYRAASAQRTAAYRARKASGSGVVQHCSVCAVLLTPKNKVNGMCSTCRAQRARQWSLAAYYRMTSSRRRAEARERHFDRVNKRHGTVDGVTKANWTSQLETFGNACAYCLRTGVGLEMDHVIASSRGGTHDLNNVVPCCSYCNRVKHTRGPLAMLNMENL